MSADSLGAMKAAFERAGLVVWERGWLSSNNVLFAGVGGGESVLVDTGYCSHADQTLALVQSALGGRRLDRVVNTHLHSDHCGGNAVLQAAFDCSIDVPAGEAAIVDRWDTDALSFKATQQSCPRFRRTGVLAAGQPVWLAGRRWLCLAAPGHDPESLILFDPAERILISADALWQSGFGVVFPEIEGRRAFNQVADTLDLIEGLGVQWVIPGHGRPFAGVAGALSLARQRLEAFVANPARHARHAAKVLIKFHLLEARWAHQATLKDWIRATPYLRLLHDSHFDQVSMDSWSDGLIEELIASSAARRDADRIFDA